MFGVHIGLVLSIPGGLWEITLAFWLILKGFRAQSDAADATGVREGTTDPVLV